MAAPIAALARAAIPPPPRPLARDIEDLHAGACERGLDVYADPATGYSVFTALSHLRRGACCGNACRHCPYAHAAVKPRSGDKYRAAAAAEGGGASAAGAAGSSGSGSGSGVAGSASGAASSVAGAAGGSEPAGGVDSGASSGT
jgi:hypothetical protein